MTLKNRVLTTYNVVGGSCESAVEVLAGEDRVSIADEGTVMDGDRGSLLVVEVDYRLENALPRHRRELLPPSRVALVGSRCRSILQGVVHETSIVQALLDRVEAEAAARGASAVHRVYVVLGEMSGVEHDLFRSAYEVFRERSLCRGAELEISTAEARWCCPHCKREIARGERLRCPDCELPVSLASGEEIVLQRIEMEVN